MKLWDLVTRRNFLVFSGFIALASVAFALVAQHFYDVQPCILCLYERYFYWGIVFTGILGLLNFYPRFAFYLSGLILAGGVALGFYHLGVELHWWQGTDACHGVATHTAKTIEELRALLKAKPMARCDQPNWFILGISATYINLLWFVGFLIGWDIARRIDKC
jgi:disulfide bond formation protein DsbB